MRVCSWSTLFAQMYEYLRQIQVSLNVELILNYTDYILARCGLCNIYVMILKRNAEFRSFRCWIFARATETPNVS